MTTEQIKRTLSIIDKFTDCTIQVIVDNQHLYYGNTRDNFPLIWDDANELLYILQQNTDTYTQSLNGMEFVSVGYDVIQQIKIYHNVSDSLLLVNKFEGEGFINDEDVNRAKKLIYNVGANQGVRVAPYNVELKKKEN